MKMLVIRARRILESLRLHESVEISAEEQDELLTNHMITAYNDVGYSDLKKGALEVEMLTQQVRNLAMEMGSQDGPMSPGFRSRKKSAVDDARERYQNVLERLEGASGKKAALDTIVLNRPTRSYLSITVTGRKAISDMTAWSTRFGAEELNVFMGKMKSMRDSMESAVRGASQIVDDFISPRPGMIKPELRGPALIASQAGVDTRRFESAFGGIPEDGFDFSSNEPDLGTDDYYDYDDSSSDWPSDESEYDSSSIGEEEEPDSRLDADDLFMTTYLTGGQGGESFRTMRYFEAMSALRDTNLDSGEMSLRAAAVAEMPRGQENEIIDRMKWLKTNMVLPDENDIAWLARSQYPVDEVKSRFETIDSALVASGHQEDSYLRTACAIMAGSPQPIDTLPGRFEKLESQLKYVFDVPTIAAGMLASSSLEPDEAMHVFKEAVGVVSRANYFDDAGEIENLALILANDYGPDASAINAAPPISAFAQLTGDQTAQPLQSEEEEQRRRQNTPWYYWYYWHNRYYGRPLFSGYRAHPGHMHTVPHFG